MWQLKGRPADVCRKRAVRGNGSPYLECRRHETCQRGDGSSRMEAVRCGTDTGNDVTSRKRVASDAARRTRFLPCRSCRALLNASGLDVVTKPRMLCGGEASATSLLDQHREHRAVMFRAICTPRPAASNCLRRTCSGA
jgi:hypothetical protein